jgi:hypothetical protein
VNHSGSILAVEHAAMLPAMVAVMLLHRDEYSRPAHVHLSAGRDGVTPRLS